MSSCSDHPPPEPAAARRTGAQRRCWQWRVLRWPGYILLIGVFAMALLTLAVNQMLPLAERHPEAVARWLSERAGRPVHFDHLAAAWTARGPLLQLTGLRIGEGADAVQVGQAEILIAHYTGWLPGHSLTELRLRGLHLVLERSREGRWNAHGLADATSSGDPLAALENLGELQVTGAQLEILAPELAITTTLPDVDVRLRVQGSRVRAALRARMRADAAPLTAVLDFDRRSGSGRTQAAIAPTELAPWSPLLHVAGLHVVAGNGTIAAWADLDAWQVKDVTSEARLAQVELDGAPLAGEHTPQRVAFGEVQLRAHWHKADGQWNFHAPLLRMGTAAQPQVLDGLTLAGGRQLRMQAERIDAGPLLAVLALSDRLPPTLRQWLIRAHPDAVLRDIALSADAAHGTARGSVRVDGLHIASAGDAPGVQGLSGLFTLAAGGAVLDVDPDTAVTFDWPRGFGAPHHLRLHGALTLWLDADDIHIATPALRVDGEGYAADVYGGVTFQADGSRPRLDLAAALDAVQVPVAKRFWVRHKMSPAAIHWLDAALVAGELVTGRALVAGDLDDWPFAPPAGPAVTGLFEAQGELANATVRFQPDWPPLQQFNARLRFVNDGFSVAGRARLVGVTLDAVSAQLAHYGEDTLQVDAQAHGDLDNWLTLLRRSSLHTDHADVLDPLSASGPARSTFSMHLPLHAGAEPAISGRAELAASGFSSSDLELAFSELAGAVDYDQHGFHAAALTAVHAGHSGTLSLRAGHGHTRNPAHAFEASLAMPLAASDLLARVPQLAWLRPHISGTSHWTIGLAVDAAGTPAATPTTSLSLASNLTGTALELPAPLDKPAADALVANIHARLPWDDGEVTVALGDQLAVHAITRDGNTGIRVEPGHGAITEPPPASGLVISGHTPRLDGIGWGQLLAGGGHDDLPLRALDVNADTLRLFGADFADVTLHAAPQEDATTVTLTAAALAGSIHWPQSAAAPVVARLQRLYWPPLAVHLDAAAAQAPPADSEPATSGTASDDSTDIDPRALPPLQLDVADARLGEWPLGQVSAATRRTPDGVAIDHLTVRGPQQQLDARGEWNGTGTAASTHLEIDVTSQNIGQLLQALGLGQQVRGGSGTLHLRGHWVASPMQLTPQRLTGSMEVALRNGQLVEVEPGAGRVLGLLSVAQLPRRLLLDFRDFFGKGFGFNEINGTITAADGIARTENLRINGPAAKIRISGHSDLRAQTHDQTIEVSPRTGNLLTAVGAVAAGPVGAAVGAATNAILRGPLGEIGARTYHVTGSWQEPKVEVIAHAPAPLATSPAMAPQATDPAAGPPVDEGGERTPDTMSDSLPHPHASIP